MRFLLVALIFIATVGTPAAQSVNDRLDRIEFELKMQQLDASSAEHAAQERERRRIIEQMARPPQGLLLPVERPCLRRDSWGICTR